MSQGWQLLDLYCKGVCANSPLSRGWIMMPHAKSVQPGADKITPGSDICGSGHAYMAAVVFGCVGWVLLCSSDWEGTMYLRLASGSHQSSSPPLSFPSAWNTHLSHVMIFEATDRDYADSTQHALYTLKTPSPCTQDFRHKVFLGLHLYSVLKVFKLPSCAI